MNKKNILSLLLCLTLFCTLIVPGTEAYADSTIDSGMKISKTATANDDGTYTITLEAFATGEKTISTVTKDVPTDIILVLDLSSSMTEDIGTVSYSEYSNKTNEDLYALRHNGGSANLWYEDGNTYYSVSVTADERVPSYTDASSYLNSSLYTNRNNLYAKIGDDYIKVTVERSRSGWSYTYTYTYTYNGETKTVTSSGANNSPSFDTGVVLNLLSGVDSENAAYTYTYTDSAGKTQTITTSDGGTVTPSGAVFYSKSTSTSGGGERLSALKTACTNFADAVAKKCTTTDGKTVSHRIAVVGFNKTSTRYTGTSEATALIDMSTSSGESTVKTAITNLTTSQGTVPATGFATANSIFAANPIPDGETRNRVVVFFTDGYPSTSGSSNFDSTLANDAITQANTAKNTYGATVYAVAVLSGADPASAGNQSGTNQEKVNWYLQTVSSNNGKPQSPSYYLSAGDADSLNNIFQQISQQIETGGSSSTLTEETVVKDIISPYFTLPDGADKSSISLKTYKYNGNSFDAANAWTENTDATGAPNTMGATATIDDVNNMVSVTGFNFSENWCGTESNTGTTGAITYRGNKLVISFVIKQKDGFLGGNDVITNAGAGIYENDKSETPVVTFEQPTVNVGIQDVTVTAEDKNVYLLGNVTAQQLKSGAAVKVGNVELNLAEDNYGLADWQTEYVNITVEVKDKDGNVITDGLEGLTDNTTYTVAVAIEPKVKSPTSTQGTTAVTQTGEDAANINVFKPELTFKDSTAYYGDNVPEFSDNLTKTEWKHNNTLDTASVMLGDKPELDITYTPDSDKINAGKINTKKDIGVDVNVKIDDTDVTEETTFLHKDCADQTCTLPEGKEFLIHVKTCTLDITKSGGAADESYVFDVYRDNEKYSEVTVWGNGTEKLIELPIGTYTIKENTGWSWRYSANDGNGATLTADSPTGSITCTNSSNGKIYWLNGFSEIVRNIISNG